METGIFKPGYKGPPKKIEINPVLVAKAISEQKAIKQRMLVTQEQLNKEYTI